MEVWGVSMSIFMMFYSVGSFIRWRLDVKYFFIGILNDFISFFFGGFCFCLCVIILLVLCNCVKIYNDGFVVVDICG